MRILVTGWQGQLARALSEKAVARPEISAFALGRPALNICEARSIERTLGDITPDILINTAGYTAVDNAETEVDRAFALNRDGAGMLAAAAARRGVPIIHISTDYVFNGEHPASYVESDATDPKTVYGQSKLQGEVAVANQNPHHVILRTAWVFSPYGKNFVRTIIQSASTDEPLRVVDDQIGNPTYAPHLADAIFSIAKRLTSSDCDHSFYGIFNAVAQGSATWAELASEVMKQRAGNGLTACQIQPAKSEEFPKAAARPANSRLNCDKLKSVYGIELPGWQAGVAECLQYFEA